MFGGVVAFVMESSRRGRTLAAATGFSVGSKSTSAMVTARDMRRADGGSGVGAFATARCACVGFCDGSAAMVLRWRGERSVSSPPRFFFRKKVPFEKRRSGK